MLLILEGRELRGEGGRIFISDVYNHIRVAGEGGWLDQNKASAEPQTMSPW